MTELRLGILGSGSIGTYVGGRARESGISTVLVGRSRLESEIRAHGLTLTDFRDRETRLGAEDLGFTVDPSNLAGCDLVFVTVKNGSTRAAGELLSKHVGDDAIVVSLQNGVRNAAVLREESPSSTVLAGMVPFNVVQLGNGRFHCGTSGTIAIEERGEAHRPVIEVLQSSGFRAHARADIEAVLWGKLVFNLNNALNALSGIPLREQIANRAYRLLFADCMTEALRVLAAAGIRPAATGGLIPRLAPHALRLPDAIFFRIARAMVSIDPNARSSMWEDLQSSRRTEIDFLNGEIVRLGERVGMPTPVSSAIVTLIRRAEDDNRGSPGLSASEIRSAVTAG